LFSLHTHGSGYEVCGGVMGEEAVELLKVSLQLENEIGQLNELIGYS